MKLEEIELLRELTIVMPTYNRLPELERAIEYWRDTPVTLHILDGSLNPSFCEGRLFDSKSIYYHHKPTLPSVHPQHNVMSRLVFSASLPQTKYSAVCCDDDFYTISGLAESIKHLENNIKIDAVVGSVFTYAKNSKRILWYFKYKMKKNNLLETDLIEEKVNLPLTWFLYAVCKTSIWREFITTSYENKEFTKTQFSAHEWMMLLLSKAMFRTKYLKIISQIRQDTIIGASPGPKIAWIDWLSDPDNHYLVDEVVGQLVKGFNFVSSPADYEKNLRLARKLVSEEQISSHRKQTQSFNQVLRRIGSGLVFKMCPNLKVFSDRPHKLKDSWEMLDATGLGYERRELENINDLLLKPREELRLRANI